MQASTLRHEKIQESKDAKDKKHLKGIFISPDISAVAQKFYIPGVDDQTIIEKQRRV